MYTRLVAYIKIISNYTQSIARVGIHDDPAPIPICLGTFFSICPSGRNLMIPQGHRIVSCTFFFSLYLSLSVEIRLKVAGKKHDKTLIFFWPTSHDAQNTWPIDTIDKILKGRRIKKKQHRKYIRSCITGAHPHRPLAKNPKIPSIRSVHGDLIYGCWLNNSVQFLSK